MCGNTRLGDWGCCHTCDGAAVGRDVYDYPPPITCGVGRMGCDGIGPDIVGPGSFCADGRLIHPPT